LQDKIIERNKIEDLYFLDENNHIIFLPQGWYESFSNDDPSEVYCWIGQSSVDNWLISKNKEWFTYDAQGWISLDNLSSLKEVLREEAINIDPSLFKLLDAINSGEAI
jgi:hypothetical protein